MLFIIFYIFWYDFLIYFLFLFFNFIFYLYNIVLVLPYTKMNLPQVYMCSPSWTLLPPPSPHQPSGSSQCTSPKHPVSCIEPGLATRFIHDITQVSMPFSQIFPHNVTNLEKIRKRLGLFQIMYKPFLGTTESCEWNICPYPEVIW